MDFVRTAVRIRTFNVLSLSGARLVTSMSAVFPLTCYSILQQLPLFSLLLSRFEYKFFSLSLPLPLPFPSILFSQRTSVPINYELI